MPQHLDILKNADSLVYDAIMAETARQQDGIEMIPSENYVSEAVMDTIGSVLTNKYSEGYPSKRYYGGNEHIDVIENLARNRAKELFGAEFANVQPYSGSPANLAVYYALAEPGDTILGMSLPDGGHLTHGWKVSFSGRFYNPVQYGVNPETGLLDYDEVARLAKEHKPKLIWAGSSAYAREIDFNKFAQIAEDVGAHLCSDIAHISGLVATGLHSDPVPVSAAVTMTTHKMLRGPRGAMILCKKTHSKAVNKAIFPALQGGPHNQTTAGIAVCLGEALQPEYKAYCEQVISNAKVLAEVLMERGLKVATGGTDNHIVLVDLTATGVTGKEAQVALDHANITTNANTVPGETRSAFNPSGIRLGTSAATTRGLGNDEMKLIGGWFADVVEGAEDESVISRVKSEVVEMCGRFPLWY